MLLIFLITQLKNRKIEMAVVIVIGLVCGILWVYLKTKENWDNMTKPPAGWTQHKGVRRKMDKP